MGTLSAFFLRPCRAAASTSRTRFMEVRCMLLMSRDTKDHVSRMVDTSSEMLHLFPAPMDGIYFLSRGMSTAGLFVGDYSNRPAPRAGTRACGPCYTPLPYRLTRFFSWGANKSVTTILSRLPRYSRLCCSDSGANIRDRCGMPSLEKSDRHYIRLFRVVCCCGDYMLTSYLRLI